MINTLSNIIRNFITEGRLEKPGVNSYLESVVKILEFIKPKSQKEAHYLDIARQHLKEIRSNVKKLLEENATLHEQVKILEEKAKPKRKK
jgi:predicted butyrate kinase (DUF1464 family)